MSIKYMDEYRDSEISRKLVEKIGNLSRNAIRLMEVCGTHTVAIFRSGIRSVLPETITLLSGPGCPVCVTDQKEIDAFIELARTKDVIITTFGDLMRVPGTFSSLQQERADGRDIRVVYSTFDALEVAKKNPEKKVVFLGIGFETTAPTIAAAILAAVQREIENFLVISAHKLVPPALEALVATANVAIDGFILPGHVSVIIGLKAYQPFFEKHRIPSVVTGFEPTDILQAILILVEQVEKKYPRLENAYQRAVTFDGNAKAWNMMQEVFETVDAGWRGLGVIPQSGLKIRERFRAHDAARVFDIQVHGTQDPRGCACGEILTGLKTPPECPLYKTRCSPTDPVGPCMVSSEGTCAAYYRYHAD
ncbi:MAG: hydrogenase formation protein HypD [Desulfobacterales bacterium]|nr:MAG: hydrogenase formation protein HypD [Desulfobacterales bacterium]